jgi:ankyrin repeat protein
MSAAAVGHIDNAIALLDHGANVNKTVVAPKKKVELLFHHLLIL